MYERKTIQDVYIRTCRDSGWRLDWALAAQVAAAVLGIGALDIWSAVGTIDNMKRIATGEHPVCRISA